MLPCSQTTPQVAGVGQARRYFCFRIKQLISQPRAMEAERQCKAISIFLFCPTDYCFEGGKGCARGGPKVSSRRFVNALLFFFSKNGGDEHFLHSATSPVCLTNESRNAAFLPELSCKVWQHCHQDIQTLSVALL